MAALPFHYYLALREDWVKSNTVAPAKDDEDDARLGIDFNAESLRGEAV